MFKYLLKKEFTLILRDLHALLVLFVMPVIFILIMSLALKNSYSNSVDTPLKVAISSSKNNKSIKTMIESLNKSNFFEAKYLEIENKKETLYKQEYDFIIEIQRDYIERIKLNDDNFKVSIYSKPDISLQKIELLKNLISNASTKIILEDLMLAQKIDTKNVLDFEAKIQNNYIYKKDNFEIEPSSTQQSVPAWLVFSMFFILIPISNTFINEKNFGTIDRIRSIKVSLFPILLGKIIPYYFINQIQVVFMILVGIYLVPLLGGDSLEIKGNIALIFLVSSALSFASISFALLIANISKTTEEATTIGGVSNIILAAIGGIMVPKFVMPKFMQDFSDYSPMSWGLESFLEVFVRGGSFNDISTYLYNMIVFAIICLLLAYTLLKKRR
ncbi:ABC transporter permease [Halarcobacter bivalviorum]|uniref:ABC transporter n=1 Tax=Halarcobacter bivalviorum TaxID=663364 RepID=A0AAX2A6J4_9BACT|nr:ABC transporter permease [Halarcobacter bivalviorum]AXH11249.1 ABC transporter, permease protein [Halarcobacter bivalviorum]RXK09519.1 ABC transporter [Halarcobacter bivalviorum]